MKAPLRQVLSKIGASACLCGIKCRYDGASNEIPIIKDLFLKGKVVPVCPEVLGGLAIPRIRSERFGDIVINEKGDNVTNNFVLGANLALEELGKHDISFVVLKDKSPSCGVRRIYDGTFSKNLIEGKGIFTELIESRYKIVSDNEIAHKDFL